MTPSTQADSPSKNSSLLHRIFSRYDPEAAAVISIVLGIVQVLLAVPVYFMKFQAFLYVIPLIIGILFLTGGSLAFACCKSSDRRLLKGCAYSNLVCLFGAMVAVCIYMTAICTKLPDFNCTVDPNEHDYWAMRTCDHEIPKLHHLFHGVVVSLLVYDIAAMVLHSLLSTFSGKSMDKLQDLSQSELQDLLDNSERVESMALESDEIQNIQLEREMALASNRSLAERNLDMKPRLEQERERLVQRYSELEEVRDRYKQRCTLRDNVMGQVSPEVLFSRLQTEGASTEAESETLAEEFLEGSLSLDSFLDRFLSLRSLAHKRRVRIEKLQEILRQKSQTVVDNAAAVAASSSTSQDPAVTSSPWQPGQPHPQPQSASKPSGGFSNSPQNPSGSALPYSPFPGVPSAQPTTASAAGPANPPAQFPPYPSPGSSFTPAAGYAASRPNFASGPCPYPNQPAFSGLPGPPFGQFGPSAAPYPSAYPYAAGYSYPVGPSLPPSQPNAGRPVYQSGFRVPQSYS
ncbi:hypothetical protein ACEWY4_006562 [Coilia grayii]|uniref:VPS37 C-terminal domain-containing protein n=1 Tax=Coilia grayii TaxID=363190 RepID=A0ABD1KE22_9TELE